MTVSPRYDQYKDAWDTDTTVEVGVRGNCHFSVSVVSSQTRSNGWGLDQRILRMLV